MTDVAVSIHRVAKAGDVIRVADTVSGDEVTSVVSHITYRGHTSFKAMINADVVGSRLVCGSRTAGQRVYDLYPAASVRV